MAFNISAQPLETALIAFGQQANVQVIIAPDAARGVNAHAVTGTLPAAEALTELLNSSGLRYQAVGKTITIINSKTSSNSVGESARLADSVSVVASDASVNAGVDKNSESLELDTQQHVEGGTESSASQLEEVRITGTYLRGVEPITPVITITRNELLAQGYTRLDQALEQLPQNFKAGASQDSNPRTAGDGAASNYSFSSGVNLRGLGANSTLVLLNGRRLADTAYGGVTDISQIPVSAIERVEILTDGASALYGSDAVAGVVNIITRRSYNGFEVSARSTGISEGRAPNYAGDVVGGSEWNGGGLVANFDYEKDNPLFARNRPFAGDLPNPWFLTPKAHSAHYFLSANQSVNDRLKASADFLGTQRRYESQVTPGGGALFPDTLSGKVDQYNAAAQLDYKIAETWAATLVAQGSKESDTFTRQIPRSATSRGSLEVSPFGYRVASMESRVDGSLLHGPGGDFRLAIGGQVRGEEFSVNQETGALGGTLSPSLSTRTSRHITSVYGELMLPLVGKGNAIPGVQELRLDLSGRYDHYSDFGHTANPRLGILWRPADGIAFHSTYARSFQAPTLYDASNASNDAYFAALTDPKSPSGTTSSLLLHGTNPQLQPETATSWSGGLTIYPDIVKLWKLDLSYFDIAFKNRILDVANSGYFFNALQEEGVLGNLIEREPGVAQVTAELNNPGRTIYNGSAGYCIVGIAGCPTVNPAAVAAIVRAGNENASTVDVQGADVALSGARPTEKFGLFKVNFDGTYFTSYKQRLTQGATLQSYINNLYRPLKYRAKLTVGWENLGYAVYGRANYSPSYFNSLDPRCAPGSCPVASWLTVDSGVSYAVPQDVGIGVLSGIRLSVDVQNLLGRRPPGLSLSSSYSLYAYDPVNANPYGRTISVTLTKAWDWR